MKVKRRPFKKFSASIPHHVFNELELLAFRAELSVSHLVYRSIAIYLKNGSDELIIPAGRKNLQLPYLRKPEALAGLMKLYPAIKDETVFYYRRDESQDEYLLRLKRESRGLAPKPVLKKPVDNSSRLEVLKQKVFDGTASKEEEAEALKLNEQRLRAQHLII